MAKAKTKSRTWFVEKLIKLGACSLARRYAQKHRTFPAAWRECDNVDWLIWLLRSASLTPDHQSLISGCRGCKWDRQNVNVTLSAIRRRFPADRVAKALRAVK